MSSTNSTSSTSLFSNSNSTNSTNFSSTSNLSLNSNQIDNSNNSTFKSTSINIPFKLPKGPEVDLVNLENLILDDEFEGVPIGFLISKLRSMGPELLKSSSETSLEIPSNTLILPPHISCITSTQISPVLKPSHVLAITSNDSNRILLLPIHGILFASISPILNILSSNIDKQPFHPNLPYSFDSLTYSKLYQPVVEEGRERTLLPIIHLTLPSASAFTLLQNFIYTRSATSLLSSLLPTPPTTSLSKFSLTKILNPTPKTLSMTLSSLPSSVLLEKINLVHNLWQDVVALEIGEELNVGGNGSDIGSELWRVMRTAWCVLVGALEMKGGVVQE